jgi:hypothetical protein
LNRESKIGHKVAVTVIIVAAFCAYFISEAVLRQFVLHRAGTQSISLSNILSKLPPGVRDDVKRQITIAELKDKLRAAKTVGDKVSLSISLATVTSPEMLQETYAEILDRYPAAPEAMPAYINFLLAPATALKSISIDKYHKYIKQLREPDRCFAWSAGFSKLKSLKAKPLELIEYLRPLLDMKPKYREYQQLYLELTELAFQEEKQEMEQKARLLEEQCGKLSFYDKVLERRAKAKARKKKKSKK